MVNFGATRCGFHKNHHIFTICLSLLAFLSNFWQTTSGCLTKQDNFNLWPVHVWLAEKITKETNGLNRLIFIIASCISRLVTEKWGLKMDVSVTLTTLLYFVISVALMCCYWCCCYIVFMCITFFFLSVNIVLLEIHIHVNKQNSLF